MVHGEDAKYERAPLATYHLHQTRVKLISKLRDRTLRLLQLPLLGSVGLPFSVRAEPSEVLLDDLAADLVEHIDGVGPTLVWDLRALCIIFVLGVEIKGQVLGTAHAINPYRYCLGLVALNRVIHGGVLAGRRWGLQSG